MTSIPTAVYTTAFSCIVLICIGRQYFWNNRPTRSLPPGPPGLPWIGNVLGIDTKAPWLTYHRWAKTYGGIVYTRLLGKDIIIINSEQMAKELLDKRSSNTSDRLRMITGELCGIGFNSVLLPYGDVWRLHRRFLNKTFRIGPVSRFLPFQHDKACELIRHLFDTPERFDELVFQYTTSIVLYSTYNYDIKVQNDDDEFFKLVAKLHDILAPVLRLNIGIIVAACPILLKLPSWFPGMSFKHDMPLANKLAKLYVETSFEHGLKQVHDCKDAPSMVHDALRGLEEKGRVPDEAWLKALKEASATAFLAGSETSHSFLMTFLLLMVLNPAVQEKAHVHIDAAVGKARLPTIADRPSLPYIDAILRETFRYHPVTPLSVAHAATADDVFDGHHIPKGAVLVANVWSMAHDESKYPNPHAFIPERFLNEDGSLKPNDTEHIAFGFGRRICVGRHFADSSIWPIMANVLAVFKILKATDENGVEIPVEEKFLSGVASRPSPFKCRIIPRIPGMDAKKLEELIAASAA